MKALSKPLAMFSLALALVWTGCCVSACSAEIPARKTDAPKMEPARGYSVVSDSVLDTTNRYLSVVHLTTTFPGNRGTIFHTCSGVLIHPRLVLTAGHCVCLRHAATAAEDKGQFVIDASLCAKTTNVITVSYQPLTEQQREAISYESDWPSHPERHVGVVRAHPDLNIHYINETDNRELSSTADLAVILLNEPLDGRFRAVPLAEKRLKVAEPVVLVGYGVTRPDANNGGARRIGTNEVASLEETGGKSFRIAKPAFIPATFSQGEPLMMRENASYALSGDSGGPCFRESPKAFELVGIAKTSYSAPIEFSEYTSTLFYKSWIRQELDRARRAAPGAASD